jgi:hypothetical protein
LSSQVVKLEDVEKEIAQLEAKLEQAKSGRLFCIIVFLILILKLFCTEKASFEDQGMDALDAYMSAIKSGTMDTKTRMSIKRSLIDLRKEQQRLSKLVNVAQPAHMPALKKLVVIFSC